MCPTLSLSSTGLSIWYATKPHMSAGRIPQGIETRKLRPKLNCPASAAPRPITSADTLVLSRKPTIIIVA
jgi:hypothetical protein